eukprot:gene9099-5933_t
MLIPLLGTFAIATPGGGMTGNVYEVLLCVCDCAQLIAPGESFCTCGNATDEASDGCCGMVYPYTCSDICMSQEWTRIRDDDYGACICDSNHNQCRCPGKKRKGTEGVFEGCCELNAGTCDTFCNAKYEYDAKDESEYLAMRFMQEEYLGSPTSCAGECKDGHVCTCPFDNDGVCDHGGHLMTTTSPSPSPSTIAGLACSDPTDCSDCNTCHEWLWDNVNVDNDPHSADSDGDGGGAHVAYNWECVQESCAEEYENCASFYDCHHFIKEGRTPTETAIADVEFLANVAACYSEECATEGVDGERDHDGNDKEEEEEEEGEEDSVQEEEVEEFNHGGDGDGDGTGDTYATDGSLHLQTSGLDNNDKMKPASEENALSFIILIDHDSYPATATTNALAKMSEDEKTALKNSVKGQTVEHSGGLLSLDQILRVDLASYSSTANDADVTAEGAEEAGKNGMRRRRGETGIQASAVFVDAFPASLATAAQAQINSAITAGRYRVTVVVDGVSQNVQVNDLSELTRLEVIINTKSSTTAITVGVSLGVVVVGLLIFLALSATQISAHGGAAVMPAFDFQLEMEKMLNNGDVAAAQYSLKSGPREIPRKNVKIGMQIGAGNFGAVHVGQLVEHMHMYTDRNGNIIRTLGAKNVSSAAIKTNSFGAAASDTVRRDVAIKKVKDGLAYRDMKMEEASLLDEATLMGLIEAHPNVCGLVGVVTIGTPILVLVDMCSKGSLQAVLRNASKSKELELNSNQCAHMVFQIAAGMAHIAERVRLAAGLFSTEIEEIVLPQTHRKSEANEFKAALEQQQQQQQQGGSAQETRGKTKVPHDDSHDHQWDPESNRIHKAEVMLSNGVVEKQAKKQQQTKKNKVAPTTSGRSGAPNLNTPALPSSMRSVNSRSSMVANLNVYIPVQEGVGANQDVYVPVQEGQRANQDIYVPVQEGLQEPNQDVKVSASPMASVKLPVE